jgi:hypothetical protein
MDWFRQTLAEIDGKVDEPSGEEDGGRVFSFLARAGMA